MSFFTTIGRSRREPEPTAWLQRMQQAQGRAMMMADRLGPTAQRARMRAGDRMLGARRWTAPQLMRAAGIMENQISPRVCAALTATARRMEPPRRSHRIRNTALVLLGTLGAVGIAGALFARFRMGDSEYEEYTESIDSTAGSASSREYGSAGMHDSAHRSGSMPEGTEQIRGVGHP